MTLSSTAPPQVNTLRIEITVGPELNLTILLDLNVNYGPRNRSTDSRNDLPVHRWF